VSQDAAPRLNSGFAPGRCAACTDTIETRLAVILAGCFALFLSLTWKRTGDADAAVVEALFYAGVFRVLWLRRPRLVLEAHPVASVLGLGLVVFTLLRCVALFWFESFFLKLAPLLALGGVALLGTGFRGALRCWREMLVLGLMVFPTVWLWPAILAHFPLQAVVGKLAGFLLHYLGFEVVQQGIALVLPSGSVEIRVGCSGLAMTLLLLKFALLFAIVMPLRGWSLCGVPLAAIALGIGLGGVRVAVIAVSAGDPARFAFWHEQPGAQIFSTLAIVLLFALCRAVVGRTRVEAGAYE
jgi:cyanoexosortase A